MDISFMNVYVYYQAEPSTGGEWRACGGSRGPLPGKVSTPYPCREFLVVGTYCDM